MRPTAPPRRTERLLVAGFCAVSCAVSPNAAWGQSGVPFPLGAPAPEPTPGASAPAADGVKRPEASSTDELGVDAPRLLGGARMTVRELEHLEAESRTDARWLEAARNLPDRARELSSEAARARGEIQAAVRWTQVADIEYRFVRRLGELRAELDRATVEVRRAAGARERASAIVDEWQKIRDETRDATGSVDVLDRATSIIERAKRLRALARREEQVTGRAQAMLGDMVDEIEQLVETAGKEGPSLSRDLTRRGPTFLATLSDIGTPREWTEAMRRSFEHHFTLIRAFAQTAVERLIASGVLTLGVLAFIVWLRARARTWPLEERDEMAVIFDRPVASAVLVGAVGASFLHPAQPAVMRILVFVVAALAVLRLARGLFPWIPQVHVKALHVLLFIEISRLLFAEMVALEPVVMLAEGCGAAAYVATILRGRTTEETGASAWHTFQRGVLRAWFAALLIGSIASLVGFTHTGVLLIGATVLSAFLTLIWGAAYRLTAMTVRALSTTATARRLRTIDHHGPLIVTRAVRVMFFVFGYLWLRDVLRRYTLLGPCTAALNEILALDLEIGTLDVSVRDVGVLVIGVLVATWTARFVRFVMDEDVMPRTSLSVGSQAAVSTSTYYATLSVGLFGALAASGFELGKLTVLVGALGFGLAFGLQNVIQNFVAGLMLIFGRGINVGDTIQLGDLIGKVRSIGFRASVIRSFQGAEVIVPNAQLIGDRVVNWTLSDKHRRIDVEIGVAYGTDPERVIALLLEVARAHGEILATPEPEALFVAHGASSLDFQLRAWTGNAGVWPRTKSDLTIRINRALAAANIEIPFPQTDVHVRSIDAGTAERLDLRVRG